MSVHVWKTPATVYKDRKFYSQIFLSRILKNFDKMGFGMSECAEVEFRDKKLKVM